MMVSDPLWSLTATGSPEDTSLALPSDSAMSSGQKRVMNQVHSIKRSKSKHSRNGTISPTTPTSPSTFKKSNDFTSFRFLPSKANGVSSRVNSTVSKRSNKMAETMRSRSMYGRGRIVSSSYGDQKTGTLAWSKNQNGLKTSHSDSALVTSPTMKVEGLTSPTQIAVATQGSKDFSSLMNGMTISQSIKRVGPALSAHSGRMGTQKISKNEQASRVNSTASVSGLTLKGAVELLSTSDVKYQELGAKFIHQHTHSDDDGKKEVRELKGIPALVKLLESSDADVNRAAAGALRNLTFKNLENKTKVVDCDGIAKSLNLLKKTNVSETQKHITAMLWNVSSSEKLKAQLAETDLLSVLTENILVPFTCLSEENVKIIDDDVFYSATGCLKNLSSLDSMEKRKKMRLFPKFLESLVSHLKQCVRENNPDEKSVENCVCILLNLTFKLKEEYPQSQNGNAHSSNTEPDGSTSVGCFSPRSTKAHKKMANYDTGLQTEGKNPSGVDLLFHQEVIDVYTSLLTSSKVDTTKKASICALQNLTYTTDESQSSVSVCKNVLEKLDWSLSSLLTDSSLQESAAKLLSNLSVHRSLHPQLAKSALPHLITYVTSQLSDSEEPNATAFRSVCQVMSRLILTNGNVCKSAISPPFVKKLSEYKNSSNLAKMQCEVVDLLSSIYNNKALRSSLMKDSNEPLDECSASNVLAVLTDLQKEVAVSRGD